SGPLFLDPLRRHLADYATLPFAARVTVTPALLGTDAGLVGAAALALAAGPDGPAAAGRLTAAAR
ncbi:ROK family protein, partial [Kitasatospora sp. NPDC056181]